MEKSKFIRFFESLFSLIFECIKPLWFEWKIISSPWNYFLPTMKHINVISKCISKLHGELKIFTSVFPRLSKFLHVYKICSFCREKKNNRKVLILSFDSSKLCISKNLNGYRLWLGENLRKIRKTANIH